MLAILGGLGAALVFAGATLVNSRSARMIGPSSLLAWVMLIGLAIILLPVALDGQPEDVGAGDVAWLVIAGVGNVVGLLLVYAALRTGKVAIVAPVVSTQGAIAALIAVVAGESISTGTGFALAAIAAGVFVAAISPDLAGGGERHELRATLLALAAALMIGASLYAVGRASADLSVAWALLPSRLIGVAAVTLPLAMGAGLRMTRQALPFVLAGGACEVGGFALFAWGSRHGIAVAAVLASQFAVISAVAAYLLFGERLSRLQVTGVATVVVAVGILTGLQA